MDKNQLPKSLTKSFLGELVEARHPHTCDKRITDTILEEVGWTREQYNNWRGGLDNPTTLKWYKALKIIPKDQETF